MNESHQSIADLAAARRQHSKQVRIERIGALIAQGYTLSAIARKRGLPNIETVRHWFAESESLREAYEQARDLRNELLAEDAVALADTLADANPATLKLRIDARKWRAGLNRKDGKKEQKNGRDPDFADRVQRMIERGRKIREEQDNKLRAKVTVELSQLHGFAVDEETIELAKDPVLHDWTYKGEVNDK